MIFDRELLQRCGSSTARPGFINWQWQDEPVRAAESQQLPTLQGGSLL